MNFRYLSLMLYLGAVAVFLLLAKGNMTVVGIFLLVVNSMVVPGIFAGIAAKRYGGQYLTPVEIAVLFALYVLFVFGFRYLVAFLFNHYLDQFNSDS